MYKNDIYYLQSIGRYYQRDRSKAHPKQERILHRVVWTDHYGAIPKGKHIHHKDGDWKNNSIFNLELVDPQPHAAHHLRSKWKDPEFRRRAMERIPNFVAKSLAWHRSPEGREWHRKNGIAAWVGRPKSMCRCCVCQKQFFAFHKRARFCSKECQNKNFAGQYFDRPAVCKVCGKEFMASRYSLALYCGKPCATTAMHEIRKGVRPNPVGA